MPYTGPGRRLDWPAERAAKHGQAVAIRGIGGVAFKVAQLGAYVDPASAAATDIAIGEVVVFDVAGIHEVNRSGNLAAADVGAAAVSHVYINVTTDALGLAAQGLNAGGPALLANWMPFGIIVERDATRSPQVLRIDLSLRDLVRGNFV